VHKAAEEDSGAMEDGVDSSLLPLPHVPPKSNQRGDLFSVCVSRLLADAKILLYGLKGIQSILCGVDVGFNRWIRKPNY